ncbi:nuclear transport factor 2 family protein [Bradyrhizobium australafricanum]|uniref:nuclear transport factor 2 family protein n=1 Tax=Bradyrhizobium australafricanum TaxID=2821406 RepID=UPI001CE30489|nr:nuclear transport factor 2 family protein [Bradyrhizobium australafricanum]MCA6100617.1 nuclear transport factor 2 family protein [Bradyrhizobium australafricanum]
MSNAREGFDAIGIVIDWIDACKQRRLDDLLDLYDETATVECCEGGSFQGRAAMKWYWDQRLAAFGADAFEIEALMPEGDCVSLDYRAYDGQRVRTYFRFTDAGKIRLTACARIKEAA